MKYAFLLAMTILLAAPPPSSGLPSGKSADAGVFLGFGVSSFRSRLNEARIRDLERDRFRQSFRDDRFRSSFRDYGGSSFRGSSFRSSFRSGFNDRCLSDRERLLLRLRR